MAVYDQVFQSEQHIEKTFGFDPIAYGTFFLHKPSDRNTIPKNVAMV